MEDHPSRRESTMTKQLDIANAFQHADTLAARYDPAAHLYLDLASALIAGPDAAVALARERCITWEIAEYDPFRVRTGEGRA